jgi:hypothetical protein
MRTLTTARCRRSTRSLPGRSVIRAATAWPGREARGGRRLRTARGAGRRRRGAREGRSQRRACGG